MEIRDETAKLLISIHKINTDAKLRDPNPQNQNITSIFRIPRKY